MRFLLLLELELAEVHDAADRWIGIGHDLDQIQTRFGSHAQRFLARQNTDLLSICADHAHPRNTDLRILAVSLFGGDNSISGKT
jgi:hypothetical protein